MTASRIEGPLPTPRGPCISKSTGLVTKLGPTYFESGWGRRPRQRMAGTGRTPRPVDRHPTKVRYRRVSPVAAHSDDRLLSEPTAGAHPCRREPLFMPKPDLIDERSNPRGRGESDHDRNSLPNRPLTNTDEPSCDCIPTPTWSPLQPSVPQRHR
jgi:hypothetical protein